MPAIIEKKCSLYNSLFWFYIDLFYLRKSLKEFIIVDTILFDINNFDSENRLIKFLFKRKWLRILLLKIWLLKKWFKIFLLSRKPKLHNEYKEYINDFIKVLSNQKYYQKLKSFHPDGKNNLLQIKAVIKSFEFYPPLATKEILKKKNKIAFSISRCYFCIFENLGFYSFTTKNELSEILNNTN